MRRATNSSRFISGARVRHFAKPALHTRAGKESNIQIWGIVESFTLSKIASIKKILFDKYNIGG
jgi:hypothetical protein